jgi:Tfp pilus assembly protein PilX
MVKTAAQGVNDERGSAVVLLVASLGFFLLGAMGLAIDGAQLYAQRQMAQSAADAAAQAGMVTIFDGSTPAIGASAYYCTSSNNTSPCTYASKNGYTAGACSSPSSAAPGADCIYVNPNPGVTVSNLDSQTPNELQVTITRAVPMTLTKMIGINSLNVTALATAAIVDVTSPVPIIVTHPSMSSSFIGSNATLTICGGPQRSIQVNSSSPTSLFGDPSLIVDLSGGTCTPIGTGTDFGDFGGPSSPPFTLFRGTTGHYIQPADPILDPLATVTPPSLPPTAAQPTIVANGVDGCPVSTCVLYYPGTYLSSGIGTAGTCSTAPLPASCTVLFSPGIYYLYSNPTPVGFSVGTGGVAMMATNVPADSGPGSTNTGWTSNMLVYLTGRPPTSGACSATPTGTINITGNVVNLVGSPGNSAYKGILFFVDQSAATAMHTLGGPGGSIALTGTIYATDSVSQMVCGQYQTLQLQGSGTQIAGEIITSALQVNGSTTINLNPNTVTTVRQIALVNGE